MLKNDEPLSEQLGALPDDVELDVRGAEADTPLPPSITPKARRVYRNMGIGFVGIGAVFAGVSLAERLFNFTYFSGNVLPVALFLSLIGVALLWTVKQDSESSEMLDE